MYPTNWHLSGHLDELKWQSIEEETRVKWRWFVRGLVVVLIVLITWETATSLHASSGRQEILAQPATDPPAPTASTPTPTSRSSFGTQSLVYHSYAPLVSNVPPVVPPRILFSDDFSNPNSGWPVADDGNVRRGYDNGEYQILIRQPGSVYSVTPGVNGTNVQIDVDLRYADSGSAAAGIAFDISNDFSGYYGFFLAPANYQAGLFKWGNGTWTNVSGWIYSSAIHPGTATNHLTVVRNGTSIVGSVNGMLVVLIDDSSYNSGRLGLTAETFPTTSNADARFDNFVVTAIVSPTPTPSPAPTDTPQPTPTAIAGQTMDAVTYQINPAHNGVLSDSRITPPLAQRWSRTFGGQVSYPLIALGKVFVTVANNPGYGNQLYALDAATGQIAWGPIPINGTYWSATAAYDAGNLFVVNADGLLQSFDAATGTWRWSQQLDYRAAGPLSAVQGVVYVGGYLQAVDELFGHILWMNPGNSSAAPSLSDEAVYWTGSCSYVFAFARVTGAKLWGTSDPSCVGGGGTISPYYAGRLYDYSYAETCFPGPDCGAIFDATTGANLGSFISDHIPTFVGNTGFYLNNGVLQATDLSTGAVHWTFAGDGNLVTAPIAVNNQVYLGSSSGNLYALDAATGAVVWSTNVGAAMANPAFADPLPGLNAGDGLLVVPAGNRLVAYGASAGGSKGR